jgi:predicted AlkP superfamily phosphohydrolase/phosphomutase
MVVPIEVTADADAPVALVRIDRRPSILSEGDWSDWIPVRFRGGALEPDVPGMVRVLLQSVRPELRVYVSALHLDPLAPAQPLDAPSGVAAELAEELGRFHTLGIPEDAKAVVAGVLDEREYREQADAILSERRRILHREVGRLDRGVLFVYFGTLDQISHVFYGPEGMDTIREYYLRADAIAGEARKVLGEDGALMVLSDHGFAAYDRQVHLNDWLKERGYLAVLPGGGIDWSRTRAYALGLNLLYLNLRGRERDGIVTPEEREGLLARISQALESFVDPATGKQVVTRVVRPAPGEHSERTPDLIVGYNAGYRGSDKAAVGDLAGTVLEDNASAWRGDHCMDPRHVPGVFFFSRKLAASRASLADVTPTILALFGVAPPADLAGRSLLTARETEAP